MCKWNNGGVIVALPDDIAPERKKRTVCIDECIVSAMEALWREGVQTLGCCCGHGKSDCSVVLPSDNDPTQTAKAYWLLKSFDRRRWVIQQWKLIDVAVVPKIEHPSEQVEGES